ncbi:MAG: pyridoxamine 5'-phosphate oxidase family protein [Thermodesulfobacteriota bacterium]|nr:pyridoxamine 5'-phosphate oxidase family protein [Thermodesulfobacteriota bacterium]
MAVLTERMKELFGRQMNGTFPFGTADKSGVPNLVPVNAVKIVDDETILVSNQFFGKTLENLKENPKVAISFWDKFEGYQVKGKAQIVTEGKIFEETSEWIRKMGEKLGFPLKSKGAIVIKIEEIYSVSPGPDAGKRLD